MIATSANSKSIPFLMVTGLITNCVAQHQDTEKNSASPSLSVPREWVGSTHRKTRGGRLKSPPAHKLVSGRDARRCVLRLYTLRHTHPALQALQSFRRYQTKSDVPINVMAPIATGRRLMGARSLVYSTTLIVPMVRSIRMVKARAAGISDNAKGIFLSARKPTRNRPGRHTERSST